MKNNHVNIICNNIEYNNGIYMKKDEYTESNEITFEDMFSSFESTEQMAAMAQALRGNG